MKRLREGLEAILKDGLAWLLAVYCPNAAALAAGGILSFIDDTRIAT